MREPHEPKEPTPEDCAQQYGVLMGKLHGTQALFLARQHAENLSGSQEADMFQRFETEQIEMILADLEGRMTIPWKAHPDTVGVDASDSDATADTLIDPVGKKVVRFETTKAQGTEQIEIAMTYRINEEGRIERIITTETEEIPDALGDIDHPAFVPLTLPNGERVNLPSAPNETFSAELDIKQAKEFLAMMQEIVTQLAKIYNQKGWEIMLDTERTPNDVDSSDPGAVFKIERLELD